MSLQAKLDKIKKRADEATPGPWKFSPADECDDWQIYNSEFTFVKQDDSGVPVSKADGEFIAHSRTDIPKLLAVIEKLIEQREVYAERAGDQENYESDNAELNKLLGDET